jgi:hypothetical protein
MGFWSVTYYFYFLTFVDALLKTKSVAVESSLAQPSTSGSRSNSSRVTTYTGGGFFDSARMFLSMVVLAVIAILLFIKQAVTSVYRVARVRSRPSMTVRRSEQWCPSCGRHHGTMMSSSAGYLPPDNNDSHKADADGSFWEENGRYYFMQGSTKHDVTSFVEEHRFYWNPHTSTTTAEATAGGQDAPLGGSGSGSGDGDDGAANDAGCQFCRAHLLGSSNSSSSTHSTEAPHGRSFVKMTRTPSPPLCLHSYNYFI